MGFNGKVSLKSLEFRFNFQDFLKKNYSYKIFGA